MRTTATPVASSEIFAHGQDGGSSPQGNQGKRERCHSNENVTRGAVQDSYWYLCKRLGHIGRGAFDNVKFQKLEKQLYGVPYHRRRRAASSLKNTPSV